ncbi:hypothetical protein ACGF5Q_14355 [Streptomyces huasconensis]
MVAGPGREPGLTTEDLAAVRDLGGAGTPVFLAGVDGEVRERVEAG